MATIRAYTTIEQSRKLAEILPLESADMFYWAGEYITHPYMEGQHKDEQIPIWSLTALFSVLPSGYVIVKNYHSFYYVESRGHERSTNIFNNPVDACVAMIEKLNELNLL